MTCEEYWHDDPYLTVFYREADELRREIKNQDLWLQGLYNYKAFTAVMESFSYGMSGKKGAKPKGYFDYPIAITEREKEAERQRKIKHTMEFVLKGQANGSSINR